MTKTRNVQSLTLPAEQFDLAFPFHVAVGPDLRIRQAGKSLARVCPLIRPGNHFSELFSPIRPEQPFEYAQLAESPRTLFLVFERSHGITLRGQMIHLAELDVVLFLCSPWLTDETSVAKLGLSFDDFAIHDPAVDFLHVLRSEMIAVDDLRKLADKLTKQRETQKENRERLELALYGANLGSWDWDIEHGRVRLDQRASLMLGYGSEQRDGIRSVFANVHPDDQPAQLAAWRQHLAGTTDSYEGEYRARAKQGNWIWLYSHGKVVKRSADGKPLRATGISLEITARKRSEKWASLQLHVATQLSEPRPLAEIRSDVLAAVCQSSGWAYGAIWSRVPGTDLLRCEDVWHGESPKLAEFARISRETTFAAGRGLPSMAVATRDLVWLEDLADLEPDSFPRFESWTAAGLVSAVCFPIIISGEVAGVIELMDSSTQRPDAGQVEAMTTVFGHIAQLFARQIQDAETRKLALVASRTNNAVILTDAKAQVEWVNEGFTRLTGYTLDEIRGRTPGSMLQFEETDPETIGYMREQIRDGAGFSAEVLNRGKDGRKYWISIEVRPIRDKNGQITNYMAIESDITALKEARARAEAAAQQAERLSGELQTIFALSPDGFISFGENGLINHANPAFFRMTGLGEEKIVGIDERQFDMLLASLCNPASGYVPLQGMEAGTTDVIQIAVPRRAWLLRAGYDTHDKEGKPSGRLLFLRDVTRETEVDRMKSEFLATAAHELRTPMASIHGFSELLLTREFDDATRRDIIETVHRQSSLLVNMVNELLDLARIEARAGKDFLIKEQPLEPILEECVRSFLVSDDPRPVNLEFSAAHPIVAVDSDKLSQAITNLLSNAYKYSPGGGVVRLKVHERGKGQERQVGVTVQDEGIGMSADQIDHLFTRFYRADPSSGIPGTGLGMVLVKEIIELMGGSVEVKSRLGKGTEVTLWMPYKGQAGPVEKPGNQPVRATRAPRSRG